MYKFLNVQGNTQLVKKYVSKQKKLKQSVLLFTLEIFVSVSVFIRLYLATQPFSFDYEAYIRIFEVLDSLTFSDILGSNLSFPYTVALGIVPVEVGFSLLAKLILLLNLSPETVFAVLASSSVALRSYVMRILKLPLFLILFLNVIFITLFESNALRLGVASSILLFGLLQLSLLRKGVGIFFILISLFIHLQVAIFTIPFLAFYQILPRLSMPRLRIFLLVFVTAGMSIALAQFVSLLPNEKIQGYLAQGGSGSSGITLTSILGVLLLVLVTINFKRNTLITDQGRIFYSILASCVPSVVFLIVLTDIAVIGDRAWQLAFLVLSTFFYSNWTSDNARKIPNFVLIVLTLVIQINVIFRYPLSNFFSPPFPQIYQSSS